MGMISLARQLQPTWVEDPKEHMAGDGRFIGVDMRDPGTLGPGYVSEAINLRFSEGVAEPRKGIMALAWTNKTSPSDLSLILPYGYVHGSAVFSDPVTHHEWIITAANGAVWKCREGNGSSPVALPAGLVLSGRVHFIDAFNQLFLQRGAGLPTLVMSNIDVGFTAVPDPTLDTGNIKVPDSDTGIWFGNRLWVPYDQDHLWASDLLEPTQGPGDIQQFYIHRGEVDAIVGIYRFNDTSIVVGKGRGYHVVSGLYGANLSTTAILDTITDEYGLAASGSFAQVGRDVWSLAHRRGIVSIAQTETNKLHAVDVPVSLKLQPLIERINWAAAWQAVSTFHGNRFYCAVPTSGTFRVIADVTPAEFIYGAGTTTVPVLQGQRYRWTPGAAEISLTNGASVFMATVGPIEFFAVAPTVSVAGSVGWKRKFTLESVARDWNNTVLVYDSRTQEWAGWDYGDAIAIREWVKFSYQGSVRLGFVSVDGFIKLYEEGAYDDVPNVLGVMVRQPVQTTLLSRGYWGELPGVKRLTQVEAHLQTWGPSISLAAQTDGVNEMVVIEDALGRSRTDYMTPFNQPPWDPTNVNDDFHTAGREDYSVVPGTGVFCGVNGITPDRHQDWRLKRRARVRGRYVQIRLENNLGRAVLRSLAVRGFPATQRKGVVG